MRGARRNGFTLVELLVVLSIIGLLLSLAVPRYLGSIDKSKEVVLKENLTLLRDAIDKYYGDQGRYPDALQDLVTKKYLRRVPQDPIMESASSWVIVAPEDKDKGNVFDVKSGSTERALDGSPFADW